MAPCSPARQRVATVDELGKRITFGHDNVGLQTLVIRNELGFATTTVYDGDGRAIAVWDANNRRKTITYDANSRPITVAYTGGTRLTYGYDALGRMLTCIDTGGTTTWTYDAAGRLTGTAQQVPRLLLFTALDRLVRGKRFARPIYFGFVPVTRIVDHVEAIGFEAHDGAEEGALGFEAEPFGAAPLP